MYCKYTHIMHFRVVVKDCKHKQQKLIKLYTKFNPAVRTEQLY